jgi:MYXO-CTERM domain-containing protein
MITWKSVASFRSFVALATATCVPAFGSAATYSLTDLGDPGWTDYIVPYRPVINNDGQVAYTLLSVFPDYAGFLVSGGTHTRVPTLFDGADLPGHDNFANDINDDGVIVGNSRINNSSDISHAYFSNAATDVTDISPLPPSEYSDATRVTNNGLVMVTENQVYSLSSATFSPVSTYLPAGATLLTVSQDGVFLSDVAGTLYTSQGGVHTPLAGSFTGDLRGFTSNGEILSLQGDTLHLLSGGVSTELGTMAGLTELNGLNIAGIAIGTYNSGIAVDPENLTTSEQRAFGFIGGGLIDLNTLLEPGSGYTLLTANDINDHGQITGLAYTPEGLYHPYILSMTPVPEASTYGVVAAALLGLAVLVRRRKSQAEV